MRDRERCHCPLIMSLTRMKYVVAAMLWATVTINLMHIAINCWYHRTPIFTRSGNNEIAASQKVHRTEGFQIGAPKGIDDVTNVSSSDILKLLRSPVTNPHDYPFVYLPRVKCQGVMAILVASAPAHFELRTAIRQSWGSTANSRYASAADAAKNNNGSDSGSPFSDPAVNNSNSDNSIGNGSATRRSINSGSNSNNNNSSSGGAGPHMKTNSDSPDIHFTLVFFMGRVRGDSDDANNIREMLESEAQHYGDIVLSSFTDTYSNLSLKSVSILKWANMSCPETGIFVVKCDDDAYINVPVMYNTLQDVSKKPHPNPGGHFVAGYLLGRARPHRSPRSKYFVSMRAFSGLHYPNAVSGVAYGMRMDTASLLYQVTLRTRLFRLEDIYIVGFCGQRVGLHVVGDKRFSIARHVRFCDQALFASGHRYKASRMVMVYAAINDPKACNRHGMGKVVPGIPVPKIRPYTYRE